MAQDKSHFSLASRALKLDSEADIHPHLQPLHASPDPQIRPTSISLNGNTLGVSASESLARILREHPQLESANLADIFTSRLLSEIPPALDSILGACASLPKLHTVDLSDNAFGLNTVEPLVRFLRQHVPLRHLILQNNGLGPEAGAKVADALTELAGRKKEAASVEQSSTTTSIAPLETVICGRNRLESGSMAAWAKAVTAHGHGLRTIKMVQNGIRQDGITLLLKEGLVNCTGLQVLDLQDNTFTVLGSRALAEVVGRWTDLKELGVGDALLGGRGAVVLFEAFGQGEAGKKLEVLRAQYNEIDAKGVGKLFTVADKGGLPRLRRVELNGNKFAEDDEAIEGLRELLEKRKEESSVGQGGEWGLDDLSDLEEESEDEDDADDSEVEEKEEKEEKAAVTAGILKDADEAENATVSEKKDGDVDALADQLGGTHVA